MRRMWHFDKYMIAYYPALQLTNADPTNGLAWGIVGYYNAMRGNYFKALEPTLKAAKCMPDDAATMANAGSLITWYEKTKPQPKVSQEVKNLIELGKMSWGGSKQFTEARASYGKKLGGAVKKADELAKEASEKKKKAESLVKEYNKLDEEYRKKYKEAANQLKNRDKMLEQLDDVERSLKSKSTNQLVKRRNDLRKNINNANKKISEHKKGLDNLRAKAAKVRGDLDAAKKDLSKLQSTSVATRLKFDVRPPGKDGKVTAAAPKGNPKGKGKKGK